jgi:Na+-driven multidrug efflux pump
MKQKSEFNGMLLNVGLPIFFQGLVSALLNIVDTMMISSLGPAEISAVWLAGQCAFLMSLFSFGVAGGLSVFVSQYWGGKNVKGIRKVQILALSVSLAVSLVMFISAQIFPRGIMSLLSRDAQVITLGVPYLRIVSFGYLLLPFTNVFGIVLKTTERARIAAVSTMAALSSNTQGLFGYGR